MMHRVMDDMDQPGRLGETGRLSHAPASRLAFEHSFSKRNLPNWLLTLGLCKT